MLELLNHNCRRCQLSNYAKTVCLQGLGNTDTAQLAIFLDAPMFDDDMRGRPLQSEPGRFLLNMLARMSLTTEQVYIDYTVKCWSGKKMPSQKAERLQCIEACSYYRFATLQNMPQLRKILVMGRLSLEALNGASEIGKFEGESWTPREPELKVYGEAWVTFSPAYLTEKKAEIPNVYRVIWKAAEEAGLTPRTNLEAPHFAWEDI